MSRPGSPNSICTDPLWLAVMAIDAAQGHLRDYADGTDDPAPEAVHAADYLDTILALLARIAPKVSPLQQAAARHTTDAVCGGSGAIGGNDGCR